MSDNPYVRVLDITTGLEQSLHQSVVDANSDHYKPVKDGSKPAEAVDLNGDPLPPVAAAASSTPTKKES